MDCFKQKSFDMHKEYRKNEIDKVYKYLCKDFFLTEEDKNKIDEICKFRIQTMLDNCNSEEELDIAYGKITSLISR